MIGARPAVLMVGLVTMSLLAGCSSTPPGPRLPVVAQDPIRVTGESVAPLTFPGVDVDIDPGTVIGYNYEGAGMARTYEYAWGPSFTEQTSTLNDDVQGIIEAAGYRFVPYPEGGATATPAGETVLELRSFVHLLEFNSYSDFGGYYQAYCEIDWELFRPGSTRPVFKTRTAGFWKEDTHTAGVFQLAFNGALDNLLAQDAFVAAMAAK